MKRSERQEVYRRTKEKLINEIENLIVYRDYLEEAQSKREAQKLDTIIGKMYDLMETIAEKYREGVRV